MPSMPPPLNGLIFYYIDITVHTSTRETILGLLEKWDKEEMLLEYKSLSMNDLLLWRIKWYRGMKISCQFGDYFDT